MMHSHVIIGDNSAEFGQICMDILRQSGFTANTTEKDGNQLLEQIDKDARCRNYGCIHEKLGRNRSNETIKS